MSDSAALLPDALRVGAERDQYALRGARDTAGCAGHTADVLVGLEPLNPQAWEKSCSAAFMSPPTIRGQA